jgi:hypothetical protein
MAPGVAKEKTATAAPSATSILRNVFIRFPPPECGSFGTAKVVEPATLK